MPTWTKEQNEAIYKEGQNILVSAGAGSGKTAVLSERVLRKCLDGVSVSNILVLTFTNAAAKEMKDRIRRKLSKNAQLKEEADKVDASYITTFDAFALSVVKKYHYLLNLPSELSISDASMVTLKKTAILDSVFDEYYQNENPLFLKLINSFCLKDDNDIKKYLLNTLNKLDLMYNPNLYLDTYLEQFYSETHLDNLITEFITILKNKILNLSSVIDEIRLCDIEFYENTLMVLNPLLNSNTYEEIKFNSLASIPRLPKNSSDELKSLKDDLKEILDSIKELCVYSGTEEIKNDILSTKENVSSIIMILKNTLTKINEMKEQESIFEFSDISKFAIKLVKNYPEVRNFYQNQFQEIMIDEYQDTSDLQELFINEIAKNNIYMVGDVKQSIYRFRNANPNLFRDKYQNYYDGNGGIVIDLTKNFRSRSNVVNLVNLVFSYIMDNTLGGVNYRLNTMIFGNTSYDIEGKKESCSDPIILNYELPEDKIYSSTEIEIFTIAQDIQNKIKNNYEVYDMGESVRPCTYKDFAILLDRATNFDLYKKIFNYLNIPLTTYKDESIRDVLDIKIIKNIIQLICCIDQGNYQEDFRYAFISIARSYLFELKDDEIFSIIKNKSYKNNVIYEKCLTIQKNIHVEPISITIEKIIDSFNFMEKIIRVGDINMHLSTLDYLQKLTMSLDNYYDLASFSDYLSEIINGSLDIKLSTFKDDANSVKLMTIHKSKGLEFPICYFAGLASKFNINDVKDKFLFSNKYGFIIPCLKESLTTLITKPLLKNSYLEEEISEKIRLFYVALTRPKEQIIFVTSLKGDKSLNNSLMVDNLIRFKYRSFNDFLESIYDHLKTYIVNVPLEKINLSKEYNYQITKLEKKIEKGQTLVVEEPNIEPIEITNKHMSKEIHTLQTPENLNTLKTGIYLHSVMENMNLLNPSYDFIDPSIINYVKKFVNSGILVGVIKDYHEYEFIYEENGVEYHGIIDLILEYEDHFLIVDYKLKNIEDEAYQNQLSGYHNYLKKVTNKPIKLCLYSFLTGEFNYVDN